ncbi:MAG: hypothetical protein OXG44_07385 [Gammaproteobacteria bacterium]|nr:hypothetical protein [Gammaproteobacteria bacterium]
MGSNYPGRLDSLTDLDTLDDVKAAVRAVQRKLGAGAAAFPNEKGASLVAVGGGASGWTKAAPSGARHFEIYARSVTTPETPTATTVHLGDEGEVDESWDAPAGWSKSPPAGTGQLWKAIGFLTHDQTLHETAELSWSAPFPDDAGRTSVSTDGTLTGDGTSIDPLRVANPFTEAYETRLDGIEAGAQVNPDAQEIADAIDGDRQGDIDFSRVGQGAQAALRGLIRNGVITPAALDDTVKDLLLIAFPDAGSRNLKFLGFDDDTLEWRNTPDGVDLSDAAPQPPGPPVAGAGTKASRDDHVHRPANWGEITAKPAQITGIPAFPAAGSRDDKVLGFTGDSLGWVGEPERVGFALDQIGSNITVAAGVQGNSTPLWALLPDIFVIRYRTRIGATQASEIVQKQHITGGGIDFQYGHSGANDLTLRQAGGTLFWDAGDDGTLSFWSMTAPGGGEAPTLANVLSALGLDSAAEANRGKLAVRHADDDEGLDWISPGDVGWISSKAQAAAKMKAVTPGYAFTPNAGRDSLDFTGPDTTDPWPTPTPFDGFTEAVYPADGTDLMVMEGADGLVKIGVDNVRAYMQEGTIDHVRVVQHGTRTAFGAPPASWTWDIENHLTGNSQRDPRHISLAAVGGATPDSAYAWWQEVFQGGTGRIRLKSDSSGAGVEVTCDAPARGIKQGQPFYLFDLILSEDLSVTAASGQTTAQLPVEFSYLRADVAVIADTFDIEGATITSPQPNVAKIVLPDAPEPTPLHAGDGIDIGSDIVSVKPPPYIGGFWGNASEGTPDVEVMRLRDLVVEDTRSSVQTELSFPEGITIRGINPPINGIGMLDGQKEKLSPVPGSNTPGQQPPGVGKWTGDSNGDYVWNGNWPAGGMDIVVGIDMSDFQVNDYIDLTATCSNNSLWGSARTPDRGIRFGGAGDSLHHYHSHIYELRPSGGVPDGTKISLFAEAIRPPDRDTRAPIGLYREGNFYQRYQPSDPTAPKQVFQLDTMVRNTSIDVIGSDAFLIPVTYTADNRNANHLDVDSGDTVFEFNRAGGLGNVLMELLSTSDTVGDGWTFEVWTYAEGEFDWHKTRSYDVPSPMSNSPNPVVHRYFDNPATLDGQQFVFVARGLTAARSKSDMGDLTVSMNTNPDKRFPERQVLANGQVTTEIVVAPETQRASGQRTWAKPDTAVDRWLKVIVSVEDSNGAQHSAPFDLESWRDLDESKQMNAYCYSQPGLGANQELSRGSDGRLTYDSGSASVQVVKATLYLER